MVGKKTYNPATDIPSIQGKTVLVTGGSNGLGKETALQLAKHNPLQIWIAARNAETADQAITEMKSIAPGVSIEFLELNLSSFDSIKSAARKLLASVSRLDILVLNAGIMARPPGLTSDGYEVQFGTNHVGHALLLKLLFPLLIQEANSPAESTASTASANVRVVFVSSVAHKYSTSGGIDFKTLKTDASRISTNDRYGQSKLANVLYARAMAERFPQITSVSIHPGTVKTDLQKTNDGSLLIRGFQAVVVPLIGVTVEDGAKNQLWAATAKGIVSGEYYEPVGVPGKGSAKSKDKELIRKLWEWTKAELASHNI